MEIKTTTEKPDDLINELLRLWEASVRATHHFLAERNIDAIKPQVSRALAAVGEIAYSVDEEERIAGFMAVERGKIEMLFIHPEYRGCGLGKTFIQHAVGAHDAAYVDVNEQNTQGVGFYRHMGFEIVGRSPLDGNGNPFPLLHMRRDEHSDR